MSKASLRECIDEIIVHRDILLHLQANLNLVMTIVALVGDRDRGKDVSLEISLKETKVSLKKSKTLLIALRDSEEFAMSTKNEKELHHYLEQCLKSNNNCYPYEHLYFVYDQLTCQKFSQIKSRLIKGLQNIKVNSDFDTTESLTRVHSIVSECCSIATITLLFFDFMENKRKAHLKAIK